MKRYRIIISGRVQGVWYRQSMLEVAKSLNIKGWVRNLPDGKVEACVEGEEEALKKIIQWCRIGPPHASVEDVEIEEELLSNEFKDFIIRY